jgi:hypothetical protein
MPLVSAEAADDRIGSVNLLLLKMHIIFNLIYDAGPVSKTRTPGPLFWFGPSLLRAAGGSRPLVKGVERAAVTDHELAVRG